MSASPATLADAVERWTLTIVSPGNRAASRQALLALLAVAPDLSAPGLARWRDDQMARGLAPGTIRGRITAVRGFAAWAERDGTLSPEQAAALLSVPAWRETEALPASLLSIAQLRALDDASLLIWPQDVLRRDQAVAILRILGGSGLRLNELCGLTRADVIAGADVWRLRVRGRNDHQRTVPLLASARTALEALHDEPAPPTGPLIPALSKNRPARRARPPKAVTPTAARKTLERLAVQANHDAGAEVVPVKLATPEALRRTFALRHLSRGGTLDELQTLLGHRNAVTTSRFVGEAPGGPVDPWT